MSVRWTIVSPESPPACGGVGDYSWNLAHDLAAQGDVVGLWVYQPQAQPAPVSPGVTLYSGQPGLGLRHWFQQWRVFRPDIVLIQYVPHGYGCKAMNLGFCRALLRRRRNFQFWTMFHEVAYPLEAGQAWRHAALAHANRAMARWMARSSRQIFVSIPAWIPLLESCLGYSFNSSDAPDRLPAPVWLPVPANTPEQISVSESSAVRSSLGLTPETLICGHFGTYGAHIAPLLSPVIIDLAEKFASLHFMFMGQGSDHWARGFLAGHPRLSSRVHAAGCLAPSSLAAHISACNLLLQPYPDGVSCRRGSIMAGLALGRAIVTNTGPLSEPLWTGGMVALAPQPSEIFSLAARLLADPLARQTLGEQARQYYQRHFSRACLVRTLTGMAHRPQSVAPVTA